MMIGNTNRWTLIGVAIVGFMLGYGASEVINRTFADSFSVPEAQAPAPAQNDAVSASVQPSVADGTAK